MIAARIEGVGQSVGDPDVDVITLLPALPAGAAPVVVQRVTTPWHRTGRSECLANRFG